MLADFLIVTGQVVTLFLMMGAGYFFAKRGWLSDSAQAQMSHILLYLVAPCVILDSLTKAECTPALLRSFGLCLVLTYIGCTYGVLYTSLSNAGFICALPVVVTPLLEWLFLRKRPDRRLAVALVLCTVGMGLMTLNGALRPALGDIICLLCAVAYAGDLVLTDRAVHDPQVNALQLGILQLGVVGFVMLGLAFLLEKPCLPQTPAVWGAALFLGVFCSGVGFVIQTVQQQYTSASHVGLIFTLEPVFSAIVAYFFAHEVLQLRGYIGAALMMVSLLVMELDWKSLLRRRE